MTTTSAETIIRPARARTAAAGATVRRRQGFQHGGWFVAPFLALFALFVIWPLLRGLYLSFTDANISGDGASFVGLDNYREALQDPLMWDAFGHSAYFTLLVVPCITVLAFLLAMLAHHIERGKWLWRLCFFMPFLLPSTVAANLWQWLFNPGTGMVNHVFGLDTPWLTDKSYALLAVVITTLWWTVGFSFLLYLAALQGIPPTSTRPPSWTARTPGTARSTSRCRCCATSPAWSSPSRSSPRSRSSTRPSSCRTSGPAPRSRPGPSSSTPSNRASPATAWATPPRSPSSSSCSSRPSPSPGCGCCATVRRAADDHRRTDDPHQAPPELDPGQIVLTLLGTAVSAVFLAPLAWALFTSLKSETEAVEVPTHWLPEDWTGQAWTALFETGNITDWFVNSLVVSVCVTTVVLLVSALAGYGFARTEFRGKGALMALVMAGLMISPAVLGVPLFTTVQQMGWSTPTGA